MAIPKGAYGRIAPRSGLAVEKGITIGAGVIDGDYRGEVKVLLFNHGDQPLRVQHGDRIAQIIFEKVDALQVELVKQLPPSKRGTQGFGSTGVGQVPHGSAGDATEPKQPAYPCHASCDCHVNFYPTRLRLNYRWKCRMCKRHRRSDDPRHTRLPGECRYW